MNALLHPPQHSTNSLLISHLTVNSTTHALTLLYPFLLLLPVIFNNQIGLTGFFLTIFVFAAFHKGTTTITLMQYGLIGYFVPCPALFCLATG